MNILPVIHRELRAAARRPGTWGMRAAFCLVATLAFAFGMFLPHINPRERGQVLLVSLTVGGFALALFSGAGLTADAITSEKRQGTLGLLFLTPLHGWQIVLGKMATHSLQVGYAMLSGVPLFFLPILLGGVTWTEVVRIVVALLLTLQLSLACGMFWSTVVREARTAVLATVVSLILLSAVPWLLCVVEVTVVSSRAPVAVAPALLVSPATTVIFAFAENFRARVGSATGLMSGSNLYWGSIACILSGGWLLTILSGWLLPPVWQKSETEVSSTPLTKSPLSRSRRRNAPRWAPKLDRAPLLWLAARDLREATWLRLLRLLTLAFFTIMLFVSVNTRHWEEGYITAFCTAYGLHLLTRVQLALTATRRLQEERRSGALELLLTTPITDRELVRAHQTALKRAFRWPLLILLGTNAALFLMMIIFFEHLHMQHGAWAIFSVFFLGGALLTLADFTALRWLALREALRTTTQMKAVASSLSRLCIGPWVGFGLTVLVVAQIRSEEVAAAVFAIWFLSCLVYDLGLMLFCRSWLRCGLRRRASEA